MMQSERERIFEYRKQEKVLVLPPSTIPSRCGISNLLSLIGTWDEKYLGDRKAIERIYGKDYDLFQAELRAFYSNNQEMISFSNKVWKLNNRNQMIGKYAQIVFDEHIENLKAITLDMISSTDTYIDIVCSNLEKKSCLGESKAESCYAYSDILRKSIFEFWAYAGNNCESFILLSKGKVKVCIKEIITMIIHSNNWKILMTNSKMLPFLAEADPEAFLNEINDAIELKDESLYYVLSNGEKNAYINEFAYSLSEALGLLATYKDFFSQAGLCLVALSSMNKVFLDKISIIILPLNPQTEADADVRKGFLKAAFIDFPENTWKLLLEIFPYRRTSIYPVLKANYLKTADILCEQVTVKDYWDEMNAIVSIACLQVKGNVDRLIDLIGIMGDVTLVSRNEIISLITDELVHFSDDSKYRVWMELKDFVHKHRRFSDSEWALPEEQLYPLEKLILNYEKGICFPKERRLFRNSQWELFVLVENYKEREKKLHNEQLEAAKRIYELGDETFYAFLDKVENTKVFGTSIANIEENGRVWKQLQSIFACSKQQYTDFATAFIQESYRMNSNCLKEYLANLDLEKTVMIYENLPVTADAIAVIQKTDKKLQKCYWEKVDSYGFQTEDDSIREYVINKLLEYGRVNDVFRIVFLNIEANKNSVSAKSVAEVLLKCPDYKEGSVNSYLTENLINFVEQSDLDEEQKFKIEWKYLELITQENAFYPKAIYRKFNNNPEEFMRVFSMIHRGDSDDNMQAFDASVYRLLESWKTIPGNKDDGYLDSLYFERWMAKAKELAEESNIVDALEHYLGKMFFYSPASKDGLFIDKTVAKLLHLDNRGHMRNGYLVEAINSRGMHIFDETGSAEFKLEKEYRDKARDVEIEGFTRFADTLRMIARKYHDEALYNIEESQKWRDNDA